MRMDVIETFLKYPSLKNLYLDDMSDLDGITIPGGHNLLRSLRHRRICIIAFGHTFI